MRSPGRQSPGGELTPSAVIARNLTREIEIFIPLSLLAALGFEGNLWQNLSLLGWFLAISSVPLWNREGLRAGDLIGGTMVIALPKRRLLMDLTLNRPGEKPRRYTFRPEHLAIYGNLELQVLEEFLRRPSTAQTDKLLAEIAGKIGRKINWGQAIPEREARQFLTDFYAAERAELERGQLFGRHRADKNSGPSGKSQPAAGQPK